MNKNKIVILIYKSKILLSSIENLENLHEKAVWSFISKNNLKKLGISEKNLKPFDSLLSYIKLDDSNVMGIVRENRNKLEFYGLSELKKISFTSESEAIFLEHKDGIQALINDQFSPKN